MQESNEWNIVVLKFQTHLCEVNSVVSHLKVLETMLFQNARLACWSPARSDLCLQFGNITIINWYADPCGFSWSKGRQVYMVMGNAFYKYKDSSAFFFREGVCPIEVIIWNAEPLLGFGMYLWEQSHNHIRMYILQLFAELTALPPSAISLNFCDNECLMNSTRHEWLVLFITYRHGPRRKHRSTVAVELLRSCILGERLCRRASWTVVYFTVVA
jgi:hypothetical protein